MLVSLLLFATNALAEMDSDKRNPGVDKYPMCKQTDWFERNWCETIEFQKQGWKQSKIDLANTKAELITMPERFAKGVKETPEAVGGFITSTTNGISNWASKEWNSIKEYQSTIWK